jgi:hypothetical protein
MLTDIKNRRVTDFVGVSIWRCCMRVVPKLAWVLLFICVYPASADFAKAKLRVVVADSNGGAIRGSRIILHWDRSGARVGLGSNVGLPEDLSTETSKEGEVLSEVPPGFYDLFVTAMSFSPDCRKIRLKPGETATFKFALPPDPLMKELDFVVPDIPK